MPCSSTPHAACQTRRPAPIAAAMQGGGSATANARRMPAGRIQGSPSTRLSATGRTGGGYGRWQVPRQWVITEAVAGASAKANGSQRVGSSGAGDHRGGKEGFGTPEAWDAIPGEVQGAERSGGAAEDGSAPAPTLDRRVAYSMGGGRRTCRGIEIGRKGFGQYISERVEPLLADPEGMQMVEQVLARAESSGFKVPALDPLRTPVCIHSESWRVGEALAERYLRDFEKASFPYPRLRDERNPYASSAGPDLVGYTEDGGDVMFLFGEVKATSETTRPPGVVRKLRIQVELLLSKQGTTHLVHYLIKKAETGSAEHDRRRNDEALKSYVTSKWVTAGVVISDQKPDERGLKAAFARLEKSSGPGEGRLRLVALYVPVPISDFGKSAESGAHLGRS